MSIGIRIAGLNPWNQIRLNYQQICDEGFCVIVVATVVIGNKDPGFFLFMILTRALKPFWIQVYISVNH
jgi:hypothetical protein